MRTEKDFPQDRVDTLYNLALTYDTDPLNDGQKAYETCAKAIDILETHIRAVSSSETRRAVAENYAGIYDHMISLCIRLGKVAEAVSYAERGKSRTLVEMLHSAQLQPSENVPREVRDAFLAVRTKLEELGYRREAGESSTPKDFDLGEEGERRIVFRRVPVTEASQREDIGQLMKDLRAVYNRLLEEIRQLDPLFAASERVPALSLSDIEGMIPKGTAFVECFTGSDGTYIFVLDGESEIRDMNLLLKDLTAAELFGHLAVQNWLRPYYAHLEKPRTQAKNRAWFDAIENTPRLLAEKFWHATDEKGTSLASLVEKSKAKRLVFFPHSGLHLLPLHLIPLSGNGSEERLMDRFEIAYAPSASLLRFTLNRDERLPDSLFAAANPNFDNPDLRLVFSDGEVHSVATHFTDTDILWYERATKEAVLNRAGRASAVHFSCHGQFTQADPMRSQLILAGGDVDETKNLTLGEIFSKLRLPHAVSVVLSACETGMVKLEQGDEYIGLPSGFLYAGAPTVISSLWSVSDFSTSLLMQRWYENVRKKDMGKAAALREAQRWLRDMNGEEFCSITKPLIEELERNPSMERSIMQFLEATRGRAQSMTRDERPFAHPYHWGAFVCTGNWE